MAENVVTRCGPHFHLGMRIMTLIWCFRGWQVSPGLEPTIYCTRGEHASHYATDAVLKCEIINRRYTILVYPWMCQYLLEDEWELNIKKSFRGEVEANKTSLSQPSFIKVSVPSQGSGRSCICVLGMSIFISIYDFSNGFLKCY